MLSMLFNQPLATSTTLSPLCSTHKATSIHKEAFKTHAPPLASKRSATTVKWASTSSTSQTVASARASSTPRSRSSTRAAISTTSAWTPDAVPLTARTTRTVAIPTTTAAWSHSAFNSSRTTPSSTLALLALPTLPRLLFKEPAQLLWPSTESFASAKLQKTIFKIPKNLNNKLSN